MKNSISLFLGQSYKDTWDDYQRSLYSESFIVWDYVILTASNEEQADIYRRQIDNRKKRGLLSEKTEFIVISDPGGKRVGSGGATFNVLKYIRSIEPSFKKVRILCIHSGGDSKRVPQYSACGKIFSPVPRELPDKRRSTLFDEFIIGLSSMPSRIKEGMLVVSGDVLLLFNPLQIDAPTSGAACISIKEDVETGKDHGVFTVDENGNVGEFLHKQSVETLRKKNAVNENNKVDIDTGAVLFCSDILEKLFSLVDTDEKFNSFVNEKARVSFYGDFLYPLASMSSKEQFFKEKPEGEYTSELAECRDIIWEALSSFSMKLFRLSPASFIHFGTTKELVKMMCEDVFEYSFLDWKKSVFSTSEGDYASGNSIIDKDVQIGSGCYIEDSYVLGDSVIGKNTVLSHIKVENRAIPSDVVLHALKLKNGKYVVRIFGIDDNPKEAKLFGNPISENIPLWNYPLYLPCDTLDEALDSSLKITDHIVHTDKNRLVSLADSFNSADASFIIEWESDISDIVVANKFFAMVSDSHTMAEVSAYFNNISFSEKTVMWLIKKAEAVDDSIRARIYFYLGSVINSPKEKEFLIKKAFTSISDTVLNGDFSNIKVNISSHRDCVIENLPLRVNWGGGWTDTPSYCIENGGAVINAAVLLEENYPAEVIVKHIDEPVIIFESKDMNAYERFDSLESLQDCFSPYNSFALHKAALIACGVIPSSGGSFEDIISKTGGIYLSTRMKNVPKGSGLGTSSILACACVKAICKYFNTELSDNDCVFVTLCIEQLMSTGGGWQDQIGGMKPGVKLAVSNIGAEQKFDIQRIRIPLNMQKELSDRFALIFTGQRRLARNLLREVVGNYLSGKKSTIEALKRTKELAFLIADSLKNGDMQAFIDLLNEQYECNKRIDDGCTNTCIEQIFLSVDDLIDARMICGAGGGGFLQVIMKKGVTVEKLNDRLYDVFQDSGVCVWKSSLLFD